MSYTLKIEKKYIGIKNHTYINIRKVHAIMHAMNGWMARFTVFKRSLFRLKHPLLPLAYIFIGLFRMILKLGLQFVVSIIYDPNSLALC